MKTPFKTLAATTKKFFNFGVVENDSVDVMLYGVIGWEVDADDFVTQLKSTTAKTINLCINSVGGDVFDGTAIYNALRSHPANIVVSIEGIAASAASVIAMAGDQINIGKNAYMMIHRASAMAYGTASDMRQTADIMDKVDKSIAGTYADKTGKPFDEISKLMDAETWMVGQEAVDAGFADSVTDDQYEEEEMEGASNQFLAAFNKLPQRFKNSGGKVTLRRVAAMSATKGKIMNAEAFNAYAAEHPEAVAKFVNQGKQAGGAEAVAAERTRVKAVVAAAGSNHKLAVDAIVAGQDPEAVVLAANTAKAATDAATAKDAEIAALNEKIKLMSEGQSPVSQSPEKKTEPRKAPTTVEAVKAQAKKDWADNFENCNDGFTEEDLYVRAMVRDFNDK